MSEKRFKGYAEKTGQHFELIINDLLGEEYSLTDDFFKSKYFIFEIVDLLNFMNDTLLKQAKEIHKLSNENGEQQATIQRLGTKNKELEKNFTDLVEWASEIAKRNVILDEKIGKLQRENKKLKEEEKLYAQEILRLNELLKQYQSFKDLGGDY